MKLWDTPDRKVIMAQTPTTDSGTPTAPPEAPAKPSFWNPFTWCHSSLAPANQK